MFQWTNRILKKNRSYIVPNWSGILLGFIFFSCLFFGALLNRHPLQLFGLVLAILYLSGMVQSNSNTLGLNLKLVESPLTPAESPVPIHIMIQNEGNEVRYRIKLEAMGRSGIDSVMIPILNPRETREVILYLKPLKRGKHILPTLRASSEYPLGLFFAWKHWNIPTELFIYPKPEGTQPLPPSDQSPSSDVSEFVDHRPYREGESKRLVDWKKYAKTGEQLTKLFQSTAPAPLLLEWESLRATSLEQKLSQFSRWIKLLEADRIPYQVKAPFQAENSLEYLKVMSTYTESKG